MTRNEQNEHEAKMRQLRAEFADKIWPRIAQNIGHLSAALPPVRDAAWFGFLAGAERKP